MEENEYDVLTDHEWLPPLTSRREIVQSIPLDRPLPVGRISVFLSTLPPSRQRSRVTVASGGIESRPDVQTGSRTRVNTKTNLLPLERLPHS